MFNFKSALSFVATTLVESVSLTAELGVAVVVTCKDIATAGAQEGVAAAKETYTADVAVAAKEEMLAAIHAQQEVLSQARAHMDATHEASVAASAAYNTTAQEVFAAGVEANPDMAALEALRVAADNTRAAATAARKAMDGLLLETRKEEAVGAVVAVGFIARAKAVLHAVYVGVRTGFSVMVDDAPLVWAARHSTAMNRHHARVDARKVAVVAPVPVAVVNEEAAAYSTAVPVEVVDVNDLTAEARVATAFAIFGVVLVRMISTVVRMAWTVIKVAVRIATFPVRKMFTITRRTRTAA